MINCAFTRPTKDRVGTPVARLHEADERGATLVMVAISLVCLLGMGALAVDLAAGFSWRAEAQKIADSSALAGGSAFLDCVSIVRFDPFLVHDPEIGQIQEQSRIGLLAPRSISCSPPMNSPIGIALMRRRYGSGMRATPSPYIWLKMERPLCGRFA